MIGLCKKWLADEALPFWIKNGVDSKQGGFYEAMSMKGAPLPLPRRAMVQARQIYSFRVAMELNSCDRNQALGLIESGIDFLLQHYALPSGAFIHSIDSDLRPHRSVPDLYTQAFALFGLANAYSLQKKETIQHRALALLKYLNDERRAEGGGFTELSEKSVLYSSNPHMHLFEAAIAWMEIDQDPRWRTLADGILDLCLVKFIQPDSGFLAEHFSEGWKPFHENGKFIFEPGHHYEWAWLLGRYEKVTGRNLLPVRLHLYHLSEKHGICPSRKAAYDEVWSDFSPKLRTTRFWPQCERIKAALQLGMAPDSNHPMTFAQSADEAMGTLLKFLNVPVQGLWFDTWEESGEFRLQPVKASSFYHIIGAMNEYIMFRPLLPF